MDAVLKQIEQFTRKNPLFVVSGLIFFILGMLFVFLGVQKFLIVLMVTAVGILIGFLCDGHFTFRPKTKSIIINRFR